tara:strand:- start:6640 stop:7329 length:690 start_codon:yes stop_codon:yes gene_type:complete
VSAAVHIPLTKEEIVSALHTALQQNFIDNLRDRHPNVTLDSKLRGYVGEIAFKKWAKSYDIEFIASNIRDYSSGMDIDFLFEVGDKKIDIELKTSLIPDVDRDLIEMMNRRDIKLIRRKNKTIEAIDGDVHVQIAFKQLRLRKDDWLTKQRIHFDSNIEEIYTQLAAFRYETDTYLMGWIDKPALINQINEKPQHLQKWKYGMREFWCCNLERDAKKPLFLIEYLKAEP